MRGFGMLVLVGLVGCGRQHAPPADPPPVDARTANPSITNARTPGATTEGAVGLVAPLADARTHSETVFRWRLPQPLRRVLLQVCRDRACREVVDSQEVKGESARAAAKLPTGSYFWRVRVVETAVTTPAWRFQHVAERRTAGYSTGGMLDVNGDGCSDLVVDVRSRSPDGARILYGGEQVFARGSMLPASSVPLLRETHTAIIGDVNADGYADVMIGEPRDDAPGQTGTPQRSYTDSGSLVLLLGRRDGVASEPARRWLGEVASNLGAGFCTGGDLDGDGKDDVGVVARLDQDGRLPRSFSQVLNLSHLLDGEQSATVTVARRAEPCSIPGDVDSDGRAEMVALVWDEKARCAVPAVVGKDFALNLPCDAWDWIDGGDFDGDGIADVVVEREAEARARILERRGSGGDVKEFDIDAPPELGRIHVGHVVTDVDGDGRSDLIVAPIAPNARRLWVVKGSPDGLGWRGEVPLPEPVSVLGAGDFDCDGRGEVAVRATSSGQIFLVEMVDDAMTTTKTAAAISTLQR
jgi:hypothetical protein